jgi:hypothetical protein
LDILKFRNYAKFVCELRPADYGVEKRGMHGVHSILQGLEPVTGIVVFPAGDKFIPWAMKAVIQGERRHLVARTHIGKYYATVFMYRISAVAEPVLQCALGRLAGSFQYGSVHIKEPPVIAAPDTFLGYKAKFQ